MRRFYLALLSFFLLTACSTTSNSPPVLVRGDLKDLVLKPRTGHADFLTSQRCTEYKKNSTECLNWDVTTYPFADREMRERLRALKFQCNLNGERFRICENSRGICQQYIKKGGLFSKDEVKLVRYVSGLSDYQKMIDAKMWCAAQESKEGRRMFRKKPKGD